MIEFIKKYLAVGLIFLSFALCLFKGGNSPFAVSMFAISVLVIFFAFVALHILESLPKQASSLLIPSVLFLSVCAWAWLQTMWGVFPELAHPVWSALPDSDATIAADPVSGKFTVLRLLSFGMLFLCIVLACQDRETADLLLRVFAIFSTLIAAYGLYAFSIGSNPILGDLVNGKSVSATFVNRNSFALFAALGALANLAVFTDDMADNSSDLYDFIRGFFITGWINALGFLICSGALFLSFSRAGIAAALLGLMTFVLSRSFKKSRIDYGMIGMVTLVVGLAALANGSKVLERLLTTSSEEGRFAIYPKVVDAILDRPLVGHGAGSFHEAFRPYIPEAAALGEWTFAHNTFLETFMEFGIPAAAAFYLAMLFVIFRIYKGTRRRSSNSVMSCFAFASVVTVAFNAMFDFSIQMPGNTAIWSIILAMGFACGFSTLEMRQSQR